MQDGGVTKKPVSRNTGEAIKNYYVWKIENFGGSIHKYRKSYYTIKVPSSFKVIMVQKKHL